MPARGLGQKYQGSKWITREKRLAIYIRDGLACVYCGEGIEDGAQLTLDHVVPFSQFDSKSDARNLVTACKRCNCSRADRSLEDFATAAAIYLNHGLTTETIVNHVQNQVQKSIDIKAAKALIEQRGGWSQVMKA